MIAEYEAGTQVGPESRAESRSSGGLSTEAEPRVVPSAAVARSGWADQFVPSSAANYLDGEDWSTPDSIALPMLFRRAIRTVAPFIVSDLVALAICGIVAQVFLYLVFPASARQIGWASPIALMPLIFFYWLGGLYSEIWVH